ncbi:MAG TPA: hypothetical protein VLZ83_09560 [Edaphocola sp.]|nr:hypothetical protein [Edaphocola sp.]
MTTGMLHLHSTLRYLIVFVAIWAIFKAMSGMNGKKAFTKADQKPGLLYLIGMDLQLVIGLVLYFMGNWGYKIISNGGMAEVVGDGKVVNRFFVMEHPIGMILALILVHLGYAATKKTSNTDQQKFKKSFWMYLISFILIIAFVPWPFRELGRAWMP